MIETPAPTANSPNAAKSDHVRFASVPVGCRASRGRADRRVATRKTSLPVSAHECAASASMLAAPVSTAATVFAIATRRFAPRAMSTVSNDSASPVGASGGERRTADDRGGAMLTRYAGSTTPST
jgi:hypothetical protein